MSNDSAQELATREAAQNGAVDAYILARPQLDSIHNRRIFEAGFQWGWKLKQHDEIERNREAIAELVQALKDIHDHPNCLHEVEAQLGEETWDVIAKYDTTTKETK